MLSDYQIATFEMISCQHIDIVPVIPSRKTRSAAHMSNMYTFFMVLVRKNMLHLTSWRHRVDNFKITNVTKFTCLISNWTVTKLNIKTKNNGAFKGRLQ